MKLITPILLTAFALSLPLALQADEKDSDGFLVFKATEVTQAAAAAPKEIVQTTLPGAVSKTVVPVDNTATVADTEQKVSTAPKAIQQPAKKAKKARKKAKRTSKRVERKKRSTRVKRAQRSSLKKTRFYRVRKGDTLYRISVRSGVRLSRLISLNKLHGSKKHNIQAGQRIRLRR